jgi:hypothetical protein
MEATLRPGRPEDASTCGVICYDSIIKFFVLDVLLI